MKVCSWFLHHSHLHDFILSLYYLSFFLPHPNIIIRPFWESVLIILLCSLCIKTLSLERSLNLLLCPIHQNIADLHVCGWHKTPPKIQIICPKINDWLMWCDTAYSLASKGPWKLDVRLRSGQCHRGWEVKLCFDPPLGRMSSSGGFKNMNDKGNTVHQWNLSGHSVAGRTIKFILWFWRDVLLTSGWNCPRVNSERDGARILLGGW